MISPIQAKKLIAANLRKIKNQKINTNTSIGYTLNETIYALLSIAERLKIIIMNLISNQSILRVIQKKR